MTPSSAQGALLVTNRAQIALEWNGSETAQADEVARVALGDGYGGSVVSTGAPLSALLERHAEERGPRGRIDPTRLADARTLAGEGVDVQRELAAARRLLEVTRALVPERARPSVVAQSSAVDVVSLSAHEAPRVAHRRNARVSVILQVEPTGETVEAKASVCVAGTLDAIEESALANAVEIVTARADRLAHSTPTPAWDGNVVFSPEAAGIVVHEAVGHLLEADNYVRLVQPEAEARKRLAPPIVDVAECADEGGHWGSIVVDDEGIETHELRLLAEGRVGELITDTTWAARVGGPSSGRGRRAWDPDPVLPRLSRILLLPGDDHVDDVLARAGDALYVESLAFGGLDARTGTVKLIIREAHRVGTDRRHFGGIVEEPASTLLSTITALGSDVEWHQSLCLKRRQVTPAENGAPTMLLSPLKVRPAR